MNRYLDLTLRYMKFFCTLVLVVALLGVLFSAAHADTQVGDLDAANPDSYDPDCHGPAPTTKKPAPTTKKPAPTTKKPVPPPKPVPTCGDNSKAIPFLRAYNPILVDHFYTTDSPEWNHAVGALGYSAETAVGHIWITQQPGTVPLYRLYQLAIADHFYTTSAPEKDDAIARLGYAFESIIGYVYPRAMCGSIPLYRLYSVGGTDHFYTPSASERDHAVSSSGYTDEGVVGYILG